jgi:hypothetical protein
MVSQANRKYMGKIYCRILTDKEIYASVKKPTITETIRLKRLHWSGHVQRMEENGIPLKKSILYESGKEAETQTKK